MSANYLFSTPEDMIRLAKEIQSLVYWGSSLYYQESLIKARDLWDLIEDAYSLHSARGLILSDNEIRFIYKEEI